MQRAIIIDDHPVIRMAVKTVLQNSGYTVVGEASNGKEAIQLTRELMPDLLILDIGIPEIDGLAVIQRLKLQGSLTKTLVFTSQPAAVFSPRCMWAGAAGFVCKAGDLSEFSGALAAIKAGYSYFPNLPLSSVINTPKEDSGINRLTGREIEVLRQLAAGATNKEIADAMMLSNKTISSYKHRIMDKLQVNTFVDLIDIARRDLIA
ncbi:response regulator [Pseudomonas sp. TE50-2]|uniref:response regulator n=1 Tax=Pseudomonas sp. TE50-2 TaxID=3142707 RepID=UPI00346643E3